MIGVAALLRVNNPIRTACSQDIRAKPGEFPKQAAAALTTTGRTTLITSLIHRPVVMLDDLSIQLRVKYRFKVGDAIIGDCEIE
jgi:hypothetical protein